MLGAPLQWLNQLGKADSMRDMPAKVNRPRCASTLRPSGGISRRLFLGQVSAAAAVAGLAPRAWSAPKLTAIQRENQQPGTTEWLLTHVEPVSGTSLDDLCRRRAGIEAYCSDTSIRAGQTLRVLASTNPASKFNVQIFRMGYYGGAGGRLMKSIGPIQGDVQPTPPDGPRKEIECRWKETFRIRIPRDWLSGVYLGKLTALGSGFQAYFVFIVRDNRRADFLFQCSDFTWQAYNRWPAWRSLYDFKESKWHTAPGNDVGLDRPYGIYYNGLPAKFNPLTNGSGEFLLWEHPLSFWMEKEGYDVTYISNLDTHADPKGLRRAKGFLSAGHDEYWTRQMMDNVTAARDAGVNLAFLSGNSVDGHIVLKTGFNGRPNRVFGRWDQAPDDDFEDEQDLMGASSYGVGAADWICQAPGHWIFAGTGMKKGDRIPQLVGWEYHGPPLRQDPGLVVVASGNVRAGGRETDKTYAATVYQGRKGNFVFNAATCWWNMLLSRPPGAVNPPNTNFSIEDTRVQAITRNLLDRMKAPVQRP